MVQERKTALPHPVYKYNAFMFRSKILLFAILLASALTAGADTDSRYTAYIERWAPEARQQQKKYRIPASITLAQGLLESAAGRSTLATRGNNHFGIKCHRDWTGDTLLRSDDAPDECFRSYPTPEQSFTDHSLFLSRKRYSRLFDLDPCDYKGWARGLKECGYATDPQYADRLIAIIERYGLFNFDESSHSGATTEDYILTHLRTSHPILRSRGLHYVLAAPGDTYARIAKEFHIDAKALARYNDAAGPKSEIRAWEEVYLQPKHTSPPDGVTRAVIGQDETLHSVAQRFGMTVESVRALNPRASDSPGTTLRLR